MVIHNSTCPVDIVTHDEKGNTVVIVLSPRPYPRLIRDSTDIRKWVVLELIETLKLIKHQCEEPGCTEQGSQCHLLDYGDHSGPAVDVYEYYCPEHATKNGYCWLCGEFWAGNEEFDLEPSHLCPNCKSEVDSESGEVDPEEAGWFE
jgi:hypothetical protein